MGTIVQTAPLLDVVEQNISDQYFNQLTSVGAVAPIVWTTVTVSPAFIVAPNGNLASSALQSVGAYTASGTMVDAASNTGIWSFTLTVLSENPTPQTSVIPAVPLAPTGIEVMTPFQINPATGQVATVQNYQTVLAQHVLMILMTARNERVMIPTYGVGMQNYVFQPDTPLLSAQIQSSVIAAFKQWESRVQIQTVDVEQNPTWPNVLDVTVSYNTIPFTGTNTITVSLGGAIPTAPITVIGTFQP